MGLDLREFRKPLEAVPFPNGAVHMPRPFDAPEYHLWRDAWKVNDQTQFGMMMIQIIRACYPTITDEDLLDCNADMLLMLAAYPGEKIDQVKEALKNAEAVAAAAGAPPKDVNTPPSFPKKNGNTSSRSTRKRSAKTGVKSTTTENPTSSGSLSTISTSPGVSTTFAESSTTSTAPV